MHQYRRRELAITVELSDFATFDHELLTIFQCQPSEQLRLMEAAAHDALKKSMLENQEGRVLSSIQILLKSQTQSVIALRSLIAEHIGKLVKVSGIIVSTLRRR